jgi:LmbE family N-acetylglucosaminyl deacetylase
MKMSALILLVLLVVGLSISAGLMGGNDQQDVPQVTVSLSDTRCHERTIMNIVAHSDDDILFMNPDIARSIKEGNCVRTVYMTSGDAGEQDDYWRSRERGAEAAYGHMAGYGASRWDRRVLQFGKTRSVTVSTPRDNPKLSLIFLRIPDGNLTGEGFLRNGFKSMSGLMADQSSVVRTVDGRSEYSIETLSRTIVRLIHTYQPNEIRTQSTYSGPLNQEHADHIATGRIVSLALAGYLTEHSNSGLAVPLSFYRGYAGRELSSNLGAADISAKKAIFLKYARHDPAVCRTGLICTGAGVYGEYLTRQYKESR